MRIASALCLVLSILVHGSMVPFDAPHRFEMNDVQGEAAIPVDVLTGGEPPAIPAAPIQPEAIESPNEPRDKGSEPNPARADAAAARHDASSADAASERDAGLADSAALDAAPPEDGQSVAILEDSGTGSSGPANPQAVIGAAGEVQADAIYVMLIVNAEVIRSHPVGARMGYLLRGIPQWEEFMRGTDIDPIRDTDWVLISGPSLVNTARDVVLIHYSAPDAVVDHAVDVVSRRYERGGRFDAGVAGVRASRAHADRAERVILRAQPHVLAVVPPSIAAREARTLLSARIAPHIRPGEAMYLRLVDPHHPMPEIPDSITEMRMRVLPQEDGGAEVLIDGDTGSPEAAAQAAQTLKQVVRRHNDPLTSIITHGLLDGVEVGTDGKVVKVRLKPTRDQIETLAALVGAFLGVAPDMPTGAAPAPPELSPGGRHGR